MDDPKPTSVATGYSDPIATTPARRPGSIRRTSHLDMTTAADRSVHLEGAARDLRTTAEGSEVVAEATITAELDASHLVTSLTTPAPPERTRPLVGLLSGRGFRAAVDEALPEERERSTPLYLLLDELPVATLVSGYALLYSGQIDLRPGGGGQAMQADICAGWRSDATMMVTIRTKGYLPTPYGPPANDLVPTDDPMAWHPLAPLPAGTMRRQRLVEVGEPSEPDNDIDGDAAGRLAVYAMFRDTHTDDGGTASIVHEYSVTATLTRDTLVLGDTIARPRVLPWTECPEAAASASRLDGQAAGALRPYVRTELHGISTCTHLNDLLRSLADLAALAGAISTS